MKNEVLKNREKYNRTNLSIDLNQHIDLSDLNNTGEVRQFVKNLKAKQGFSQNLANLGQNKYQQLPNINDRGL